MPDDVVDKPRRRPLKPCIIVQQCLAIEECPSKVSRHFLQGVTCGGVDGIGHVAVPWVSGTLFLGILEDILEPSQALSETFDVPDKLQVLDI